MKKEALKREDEKMMSLAFLVRKATYYMMSPVRDKFGNDISVFDYWPLPWDKEYKDKSEERKKKDEAFKAENVTNILDKFQKVIDAKFK